MKSGCDGWKLGCDDIIDYARVLIVSFHLSPFSPFLFFAFT